MFSWCHCNAVCNIVIWVRSWRWACLVTWFCYHLIAKPSKARFVTWPIYGICYNGISDIMFVLSGMVFALRKYMYKLLMSLVYHELEFQGIKTDGFAHQSFVFCHNTKHILFAGVYIRHQWTCGTRTDVISSWWYALYCSTQQEQKWITRITRWTSGSFGEFKQLVMIFLQAFDN